MFLLKALSDVDFLTDSGSWFQSLGAVEENERSNIDPLSNQCLIYLTPFGIYRIQLKDAKLQ